MIFILKTKHIAAIGIDDDKVAITRQNGQIIIIDTKPEEMTVEVRPPYTLKKVMNHLFKVQFK